jgi:hypothetical protein
VTPTSTVPSSPVASKTDISGTAAPGSGRPDKAANDAEQARIRGEIDGLQTKLVRASLSFLLHGRLTRPHLVRRPGKNIFSNQV